MKQLSVCVAVVYFMFLRLSALFDFVRKLLSRRCVGDEKFLLLACQSVILMATVSPEIMQWLKRRDKEWSNWEALYRRSRNLVEQR